VNFTEAPWKTYNGSVWSESPKIDKSQRTNMVCSISDRWKMPDSEKEANANLIAAAPDLYEACKQAHEALIPWKDYKSQELDIALQKAMSKARGIK
jgi:hypothetical protein